MKMIMNRTLVKSLTVRELISRLQSYPGNTPVFVASDEEGNGYGTLDNDSIAESDMFEGLILFPWKTFTIDDLD
jgi:hypothetical protein